VDWLVVCAVKTYIAADVIRVSVRIKTGVIYHREGINGDYDDFDDVEELTSFIRTGSR